MTDWAEPRDFKEWAKRIFGLRSILTVILIGCILILELRFDWMERILGAYLVTTNQERPETGSIWEKSHQTRTAHQTLEKILTDRQALQREARGAETFTQIADKVTAGKGVMLSADHFRQLYLRLTPAIAQEIISPFELLGLATDGHWHRTYFEKFGAGLMIYLLDDSNHVLRQLEIDSAKLSYLKRSEMALAESLDQMPVFKNRIYPADRFFSALADFPEDVRRSVLPHPEALLTMSGQIVRVGISDETLSGFIELGFEILNGTQHQVVLVRGHEWAVWRLRSHLEEKDPNAIRSTE
ncbi:MAG: hypothetical protein P8X68_05020 [Desulfobacterales bacterium]|jgi:hypothetical protein